MNQICLCGRIGSDIELKKTQSGLSVISFPLAVERQYQQGGERITDWIDIEAWQGTAEFVQKWFCKGDPIIICGEIRTSVWTDSDGSKRKRVYAVANSVEFVPQKKNQSGNTVNTNTAGQEASFTPNVGNLPPTSENALQGHTAATAAKPADEWEQVQFTDEDLPF